MIGGGSGNCLVASCRRSSSQSETPRESFHSGEISQFYFRGRSVECILIIVVVAIVVQE